MSEHDYSQISITHDKRLVGSLNEAQLYAELVSNPEREEPAGRVHHAAGLPVRGHLDAGRPASSTMITPQNPAVLVRDFKTDKTFIITRSDIIRVLL